MYFGTKNHLKKIVITLSNKLLEVREMTILEVLSLTTIKSI